MKVELHKLFEYMLKTAEETPEAVIGFSLSRSPKLVDFLSDLDPGMSLDWNNRSFLGLPELRSHVMRLVDPANRLNTNNVLITAGTAEANYLAIRQLINPEDEIITEHPGWPQVGVLAKAIGANLKTIDRRAEQAWRFPMDELASSISQKTRLIFLSNPNNPTGKLLSEDELNEIIALAKPHGTYVLIDEAYAGLEWEGQRRPSIATLYERGITTGSVSKALGLQGVRTGWMVTPDEALLEDAVILRENSSEIMNCMGEAIAEIALRQKRYDDAIRDARAEGRANLEILDSFINDEPDLSWQQPEGGLIGLSELAPHIDADQLAERLLAEPYRTFLLPGSAYNLPGFIRVGVGGGPEVNLAEGLSRLSACLQSF